MANILAGLGGALTGAGEGYNAFRDRQMRQMLLNAQLTQQGAQFLPGQNLAEANVGMGPDVTPGFGQGAPPPAPSDVLGATAPPSPTPGITPPTPIGPGDTVTAKTPTDQASIIALRRAASKTRPAPTPGITGKPNAQAEAPTAAPAPPLSTPVGGRISAASTSGTASPTGQPPAPSDVDPTGGALAMLRAASQPKGVNEIGPGMFMPVYAPPQAQENLRSIAQILAQSAGQQREIGSREKISQNEINAANYRADQERIIQGKNLDRQTAMLMFNQAKYGQGLDVKAVGDATKALKPYEDAASSIQSALDELDVAAQHPSAATAANLQTFLAQAASPSGNAPQVRAQLIEIAGGAPNESVEGKISRAISMIATGKVPASQLEDMKAALTAQRSALARQYDQQILAATAGHPESPVLANVLQARKVTAFRGLSDAESGLAAQSQGTDTRAQTLQAQADAAIKAGKDPAAVRQHLAEQLAALKK